MGDGKDKLEALRLARDEIRTAGYDHSCFGGPFTLVGEVISVYSLSGALI